MGKNNKYINVYVDTDLNVSLDEIMDQVDDDMLIEELRSRGLSITEGFSTHGMSPSSVYDEMKLNVLREAYSKYNLEELEQKLK
jgi:hypothetical protein